MNTELQSQTDLLLKAADQLHRDLLSLELTAGIIATFLLAILIVVLFKRR